MFIIVSDTYLQLPVLREPVNSIFVGKYIENKIEFLRLPPGALSTIQYQKIKQIESTK